MKRARPILALLFLALPSASAADNLTHIEWKVDGVAREALVYAPATAKTAPSPVVFAFHGHGGNMKNAATKFAFQKHWPEAIVVYMQGLNTPGTLTDPQGKLPGWQKTFGDQGDRDLKFFDAVLATLKKDYKVDEKRIYATGHSNGGGFTYLLWAARGEVFAAVAPCAAAAKPWGEHCTMYPSKTGTPVVAYIHSGGHQLPDDVSPVIVKYFKQQRKP